MSSINVDIFEIATVSKYRQSIASNWQTVSIVSYKDLVTDTNFSSKSELLFEENEEREMSYRELAEKSQQVCSFRQNSH